MPRVHGVAWTCVMILGLFAAVPAVTQGQVITSLGAIPNPFSPNNDGMLDQTTVSLQTSVAVDSVRLVVENAVSAQIWTLTSPALTAGGFSWVWGGTTSTGVAFSDGIHRLAAYAFDAGAVCDSAVRFVSTDVASPGIVGFQQVRSSFAPDAELWNLTELRFGIVTSGPAADTTLVRILDPGGSPLVSLGGFRGEVAETTFFWNGRDADSLLLDEGSYLFEVRANDEAGNSDAEIGPVYLDLGSPVTVVSADTVFSTAFPETLSGWTADVSGVGEISIRAGGEGEWEDLEIAGGDSVAWLCVFGDTLDPDGWYQVQVRARDVFGHEADPVVVVLGKAGMVPAHVQSAVAGPDTVFADGDEIEILSQWDRAGYEIGADFSEIDSQYVPGGESVIDNGDGTYTISYFVSVTNSRDNAEGLAVRIRATNVYRTDSTLVRVELRNEVAPPPPPEKFALDRNLFNPEDGDGVTIRFPTAGSGERVEIYTLVGERVWLEHVSGLTSVIWHGRNSDGETVASGVYLVRLGADVRKVAVVK
ncbi:MAG: hypothetical protein KAW17_09115 [Candidatus Eisenbacteria sp.]|nr:hypothetical protein [Candidatus Eisenbacteria bacterium]